MQNESHWTDIEAPTCHAYEKSKTLAEQAAWKFMQNLPEKEKFDLVTINPSFILGPNLIQSDFTSSTLVKKIMGGAFPGMPKVQLPIVDVRDVADAHLRAIFSALVLIRKMNLNYYYNIKLILFLLLALFLVTLKTLT